MKLIKIEDKYLKIVIQILKKSFPEARYFVFGSRATGKNLKPYSDLDIAVLEVSKINLSLLSQVQEDFSSSDLPFKVDLIDLRSISEDFRNKIESDFIEVKT